MKKVKITAIRRADYKDLQEIYENPIEHTCDYKTGDSFLSINGEKPQNFCDSAWSVIEPFVRDLAQVKGNFYDGWMKNPQSAMLSCNDGFRPVSFYLETVS